MQGKCHRSSSPLHLFPQVFSAVVLRFLISSLSATAITKVCCLWFIFSDTAWASTFKIYPRRQPHTVFTSWPEMTSPATSVWLRMVLWYPDRLIQSVLTPTVSITTESWHQDIWSWVQCWSWSTCLEISTSLSCLWTGLFCQGLKLTQKQSRLSAIHSGRSCD